MNDSINRFTRTVENYVKYRPHYPFAVVEFLQRACQLTEAWVVADIASGTGFLAEIFLQHGNRVIGEQSELKYPALLPLVNKGSKKCQDNN